jgi:glutamate-5-semialdehyde dehydrogenase
LPSPIGRVLSETERPNGLKIKRVAVAFGVIGIIYEARPNVTFDVFSLCLKSGNACVLKGGSDAIDSNTAIVKVIHSVLEKHGIDPNILTLLPADRAATAEILNAHGYVDLIIPRGSQNLINYVRENATIPVIETGAGICHSYFDEFGDTEKGQAIVNNAKTRRPSVCNALDCLVIHESRLADLPQICKDLPSSDVVVYADEKAFSVLDGNYPENLLEKANEESFGTEFLGYKMSVKTVSDSIQPWITLPITVLNTVSLLFQKAKNVWSFSVSWLMLLQFTAMYQQHLPMVHSLGLVLKSVFLHKSFMPVDQWHWKN